LQNRLKKSQGPNTSVIHYGPRHEGAEGVDVSSNGRSRFRFGQLELDVSEGKLFKRGHSVHLENQPLQILGVLLERPGEVVSREDLHTSLWPQGTYVDFDEGLNTAIKKLRYALGDSAENPTFIETIPRRGYRFVAPVSCVAHAESAPQPANPELAPEVGTGTAAKASASWEILKPQIGPSPRLRWRLIALAAAAVGLIVSAIFWLAKSRQSSQTMPNLKLQQLTVNSSENSLASGAISPDGKYLAYTDSKGMHIQLVGRDEARTVPQPAVLKSDSANWEIVPGAWFPDSTRFLANADHAGRYASCVQNRVARSSRAGSVWIVSVLGGTPHKLRDNANAWSVSPDGAHISFGANSGRLGDRELWLMGPGGEQAHKLYEVGEKNAICCLHFFADGQRVSYIASDESGDTLVARDLRGGVATTLLPASEMKKMGDTAWLPDGRLIYSDVCIGETVAFDTRCNYWIERLDPLNGKLIEKPRRLTNWAGFWMSNPSASADSRHIAFLKSSGHGSAYLAEFEGGGTHLNNSKRFTLEEGGEDAITDWTADSKTVILTLNRGDHYSLYRQSVNADTKEPIVTSQTGGLVEEAMVSPDGNWIIAEVWPITGGPEVNLVRVLITGGLPELIFRAPEGSSSFCARPPSSLCAIAEETEDRSHMVITALDPVRGLGLELGRFDLDPDYDTNVNNLLWDISPDGTRLVAARGPEGPIEVRSLAGSSSQIIRPKGFGNMGQLHWTADGNGLLVTNTTNGGSEILYVDLKGNATLLRKCDSDRCFGFPSPDGRHLAIYDWKGSANMWTMENF
jgi:DNA-binding winged helix-turn-helix (wHTH) protein/Tol biopolymer transport system component